MASYRLDGKEEESRRDFIERHKECADKAAKKAGARISAPFSLEFTPTGIGVCVSVTCPYCGAKEDITDIDTW